MEAFGQAFNTKDWGLVVRVMDVCSRAGMCMVTFGAMASFLVSLFEQEAHQIDAVNGPHTQQRI